MATIAALLRTCSVAPSIKKADGYYLTAIGWLMWSRRRRRRAHRWHVFIIHPCFPNSPMSRPNSRTTHLFIFRLLVGVGNDNNLQQQLRIVRDLRKIQNDDAVIVASCSSSLDLL